MRLAVRLTPRGGRDAILGWTRDDAGRAVLRARVAAPPVEGEANAALVALIAKALKRPRSSVTIAAGATARIKQLALDGVTQADLDAAFGPQP